MISLQQLYDAEERAMRAQAQAARYLAALEEIERLKDSIRDGGLCDSGSPYLDGRLRAFQEAARIADRALHPEEK